MTNPNFIHYRGYYRGPKDIGGTTALYPTEAEALTRAKACSFKDDTAWTLPEFTGTLDTTLKALAPLEYIEWKPTVRPRTIPSGTTFQPVDILAADHQTTLATIGLWIVKKKAVVMPSLQNLEKAKRIAFVVRKLGRRVPQEEAWLDAFEAVHGTVDAAKKAPCKD